jgi:predicted NBD/HSP70 family sugar kinase
LTKRTLTIERLIEVAHSGDETACRIFATAGRWLGMGIANLIDIFNPSLILISGEGVRNGELMFAPMREAISAHAVPELLADVEIKIEPLDDDAWRAAPPAWFCTNCSPPVHW